MTNPANPNYRKDGSPVRRWVTQVTQVTQVVTLVVTLVTRVTGPFQLLYGGDTHTLTDLTYQFGQLEHEGLKTERVRHGG